MIVNKILYNKDVQYNKLYIGNNLVYSNTYIIDDKPTPVYPEKSVVLTLTDDTTTIDTFEDGIIPSSKYYGNKSIKSAIITDGITTINSQAFGECSNIENVVMSDSVISIGGIAFYLCTSLTSITLSKNVQSIGNGAFNNCKSLTSIEIPDTVSSIGSSLFSNNNKLSEINFGNTRTSVPSLVNVNAFSGLPSTYKIIVPDSLYDSWRNTTVWRTTSIQGHIVRYSEYYN